MRRKSILLSLILVLVCSTCLAACIGVKVKLYFKVDGVVYATIDTNGHEAVAIPRDPVKEGYIFEGWYWDEGYWLKPFTTNSLLDAPIKESMSVYAKFRDENEPETPVTPNDPSSTIMSGTVASYTVEYYLENIENSEYTLADRFILQGKSGSEVVAPEYSYYGFTLSDASESSGIINESGTLVLRVYFKRNVFTVTFSGGGGSLTSGTEVQSVKYLGSAIAPEYERYGKKLIGFDRACDNIIQDVTITAVWEDSNKKNYDLSGVVFSDTTVTYDGAAHSIYATNLPGGVTVTYEGNAQTEAGTYIITAKFSGDSSYNPIPDKTAILTINKATIDVSNVIFLDKTVEYDGEPKTIVAKNLPSNMSESDIQYYYYKSGDEVEEAVRPGEYLVVMTFDVSKNYEGMANKTATLTITSKSYEEDHKKYVEIGSTIDLINADKFEVLSGAKKVFNDDFYYYDIVNSSIDSQYSESSTYSSLIDLVNDYSSSVSTKVSVGSDQEKGSKFMTNVIPSVNISTSSDYSAEKKSKTKQYSYSYTYTSSAYRKEVRGYKDASSFSGIVSDELKADAEKVRSGKISPEKFVTLWGTHVIMAAIYGERIEVIYQAVDTSDKLDADWKNTIEAELSSRLGNTGVNTSVNTQSSVVGSKTTESSWSGLNINVNSKKAFSATNLETFYKDYSTWISQHTDGVDYTTMVDVPDGSLYCVWDLLDDEYDDVKAILNEYMNGRCSDLYAEKIKKINSIMINDDVEFNSETGELSINLATYQSVENEGAMNCFDDNTNFSGVYEITPYYQGNPVKSIVVNGGYYTRNTKGEIITTFVPKFSLKFHKDWYTDINVILNNVGVKMKAENGFLDISAVSKDVAVNLFYNGTNELSALDGDSPKALSVKKLNIVPSSAGASLTLKGGVGNGSHGIVATSLQVSSSISERTSLYVIGGNGKVGGDGSQPNIHDSGDGGAGGTGGAGGNGINAESVTVSGNITFEIRGGNGGTGGKGGNSVNKYWGSKNRAGDGGKGGKGGYGLYNASTTATLKITNGAQVSIYGGNGGNGGNSGYADKRYVNGSYGAAGAGGDSGNAIIKYSASSAKGWKVTGTLVASNDGTNGSTGSVNGYWHSQKD